MTITYSSSWKKSSRTSGKVGWGSSERRTRASRKRSCRAAPVRADLTFRATTRSCCRSSARSTRPSPPEPTTSSGSYRLPRSSVSTGSVARPQVADLHGSRGDRRVRQLDPPALSVPADVELVVQARQVLLHRRLGDDEL